VIYTLGEVAGRVGARLLGDPETEIHGVGTLTGAGDGQITFLTNSRYRRHLKETGASAVILSESDAQYSPVAALVADNPHLTYARVAALFSPKPDAVEGVHPTAVVDDTAEIAAGASIGAHAVVGPGTVIETGAVVGPNCVVGRDVRMGRDSRLVGNVTVYDQCILGERVLVHAGAVIGADGFGFAHDAGAWVKVPQLGRVRIGNDVEIGAGTTIDRGAIEDTVIEDGVKLDNLIQIAHNVHVGAHTAMAGCVGVAGSTTIGAHCAIGGGAGILGHLNIPDGTTITATSLVTKSIKSPGVYSSGTPLEPSERWQRNFARFKQLDEMARRLKTLEKELAELKKS
jgi:UDP-3-O-[3-hydroxymyristoyl] glucosamine N-acyltransferase